ncbi:MAG: response regulator with CheY-like receiver domain and winged-helix DNA-binding domain [Symbiobacteriaceae bacterium]|nr:response regulator with CheY-like receiver domain and winged-helix DNA-binding domain [Symbiobacteriaceae bacterium]
MRILLVEDDRRLAGAVVKGLREEEYAVDHAPTGAEGRLMASTRHYDLVILDRMLPEVTGDQLLAEWRRKGVATPVLMLTALDAVADRVTGLRAGADDYLIKPFAFEELLARITALLRRAAPGAALGPLLQVGDLTLEPDTGRLACGAEAVTLSAQEFRLMEFFMRHPGQILTRSSIAEGCWQEPEEITDNAIEAQVKNLRKRIATVSPRAWLQTRRGLGYVLEANPHDLA